MKFLGLVLACFLASCCANAPPGYEEVTYLGFCDRCVCDNEGSFLGVPSSTSGTPVEQCADLCNNLPACTGFTTSETDGLCIIERIEEPFPTAQSTVEANYMCFKKVPVIVGAICLPGSIACGRNCCIGALQKCGGGPENRFCVPKCPIGLAICGNQCCNLRETYCNPWSLQCRAYHFWG